MYYFREIPQMFQIELKEPWYVNNQAEKFCLLMRRNKFIFRRIFVSLLLFQMWLA